MCDFQFEHLDEMLSTSREEEAADAAGPAAGPLRRDAGLLVVRPAGGLCERLQAVVAAGLLAEDTGRELAVLWKPDVACSCPWERLFAADAPLRVLDPADCEGEDDAFNAAIELLGLWDMACLSADHDDLLQLALERFNRAHWARFHAGLASLVDPSSPQWRRLPRLPGEGHEGLPDLLRPSCVCIRASASFYPPVPADLGLQEKLAFERANFLRGLPLAPGVVGKVKPLPPCTVAVYFWPEEHPAGPESLAEDVALAWRSALEQQMDAFVDGMRQVAPGVPMGPFVVAGVDAAIEERWRGRYEGRVKFAAKGRSDPDRRGLPQAAEDALAELLTAAQADHVLAAAPSASLDVLSLLCSEPLEVLSGDQPTCSTSMLGVSGTLEGLRLLDPSMPAGPFFTAGSWDDWKTLTELRPVTAASGPQAFQASLKVQPGIVELQVLRDRDWNQRFFPTEDGLIWGPDSRHGSNWRVQVPENCRFLRVIWDPRGERSLKWRFVSATGEEFCDDGLLASSMPFFIAGSWDDWKSFAELCPGSAGGGPPYRAKIQVRRPPLFEEFQVFRGRDWQQRFHPSLWGGRILGPSSSQGKNWRVELPAECRWLKVTWDPRGHRSLRWRCIGARDNVLEDMSSAKPLPTQERRPVAGRWMALPPKVNGLEVPQRLGAWRLQSVLGKGYVGAVFKAKNICYEDDSAFEIPESEEEAEQEAQEAALKYPALACEVDALKRARLLDGVPSLLDTGYGPGGRLWLAMPVLGHSLKSVLRCCDHDGRGGRVSWRAAQALGRRLVVALRGIHKSGLVHCDVNPGNVLFRLEDAEPQLIDFGWARDVGAAHFEKTIGTCMYNSVRAGFGGQRTPADDLESLGWLLLHCVLGRLPWADRDEGVSTREAEAWQRRSEGISVAKALFLGDHGIFGPEFEYCPPGLATYLRICEAAGPDPAVQLDYDRLLACLGPYSRGAARDHWGRVAAALAVAGSGEEAAAPATPWQGLYVAPRGLLCWRPEGAKEEGEKVCSLPKDTLIRVTGEERTCKNRGRWLQVDPVWAPKMPPALLESNWLLKEKVRLPQIPWEEDDKGPLLVPAPGR